MIRRARIRTICLLVLTLGWAPASVTSQDFSETLEGWLHVIWGDPRSPGNGAVRYILVDAEQKWTELDLHGIGFSAGLAPLSLDRQRVIVSGRVSANRGAAFGVQTLRAVAESKALLSQSDPVQKPYAVILCRFGDSTNVTPLPKTTYENWVGTAYPGMDHFWREVSDGRIAMNGNQVHGWYDLPNPRSYYMRDSTSPDLQRLTQDCTAAADPDVFFPDFAGIVMQVNTRFGCCSYGGSTTLSRDGFTRQYGAVWNAAWAGQSVYAHEIGHSFGLPHSSGSYGAVYDSPWDVMSNSYIFYDRSRGTHIAQHTIAFHKDLLGAVPALQKFVPTPGSQTSITLERSAQPTSSNRYLMAQIPIGGNANRFYTVETRRRTGYDSGLPGEEVIIHNVDRTRAGTPAQVVDPDDNGRLDDAGAMWTVGETFSDPANEISVFIESKTATTSVVRITLGGTPMAIVSDPVRPEAIVAAAYDDTIRVTGAPSSVVWTLVSGSLPAGVALGQASGRITGAPLQSGQYTFTINASSGALIASRQFSLSVNGPLVIDSDSVRRDGVQGASYADTLRASGGTAARSWQVTGGSLPAGVVLTGGTGILSGSPSSTGVFRFTAAVTSANTSTTASMPREFRITVIPPVVISSDSVRPIGTMGAAYSDTVRATGGSGPAVWSLRSGALPPGVTLVAASGALTGIPTAAGSHLFALAATSGSLTTVRNFAINIGKPNIAPARVLDHLLGGLLLTADEARFLDLLGNRNGNVDVGDVRAWLIDSNQLSGNLPPELRKLLDADAANSSKNRR